MDMVMQKASRTMKEAFIKAFRQYFDFKGRTSRYDYWSFMLVDLSIRFVLGILGAILPIFNLLTSIYQLVLFIPRISITIRRLHDVGKSAWWFFRGIIFGVVLLGISYGGAFLLSTSSLIFFLVLGLVYLISWSLLVFFFIIKKGIEVENEWGDPIFEDVKQQSTGKKIIIFYICFMAITLIFGGISGYLNARGKYKTYKLEDQILLIKSNVISLYSSQSDYQGLNNVSAAHMGVIPSSMLVEGEEGKIVTSFGGQLYVNAVDDGDAFVISVDSVSENVCLQLKDVVSANATDILVDGLNVDDCQACGHSKCVMTWKW